MSLHLLGTVSNDATRALQKLVIRFPPPPQVSSRIPTRDRLYLAIAVLSATKDAPDSLLMRVGLRFCIRIFPRSVIIFAAIRLPILPRRCSCGSDEKALVRCLGNVGIARVILRG